MSEADSNLIKAFGERTGRLRDEILAETRASIAELSSQIVKLGAKLDVSIAVREVDGEFMRAVLDRFETLGSVDTRLQVVEGLEPGRVRQANRQWAMIVSQFAVIGTLIYWVSSALP